MGELPPTFLSSALLILFPMQLTGKQRHFCGECLLDLNGNAACNRAGYRTTRETALVCQKKTGKTRCGGDMRSIRLGKSCRIKITAGKLHRELFCHAFSDVRKLFDSYGEWYRLWSPMMMPPRMFGNVMVPYKGNVETLPVYTGINCMKKRNA